MVYPSSPTSSQTKSKGKISHADLLKAIDSKDAFFDLCIGITNRAIEMYANASRRKFALKLHGSLAALDVYVVETSKYPLKVFSQSQRTP